MRDRRIWLRRSNELIHICDAVRERLYANIEKDPIGKIVSVMLLKGMRTFRAIRILYMNELEAQAQALVRVLFETMIELNVFVLKLSEDHEGAVKRVIDAMMLQKVQQARESKWVGFDLVGLAPKQFLDVELEIMSRYTKQEVEAMRKHGFSGLPLRQRAEIIQATESYNIIYRNFSRNVHSTDYAEHLQDMESKQDSRWSEFKSLRDAVGFSAAATFLWSMAYTATTICCHNSITKMQLLIQLDRMAAKFRRVKSWVDLGPVEETSPASPTRPPPFS